MNFHECPKFWVKLRECRSWITLIRFIGILSLLGFAFLLISLRSMGARNRPEAFFQIPASESTEAKSAANKIALGFDLIDSQNGVNHHAIYMETDAATTLLNSQRIGLLLVCNWTSAEIILAEIVFSEKKSGKITARYLARHGALILENRALFFERKTAAVTTAPCEKQTVTINIISRGAPALAVMGQFSEEEPISKYLWMPATSRAGTTGVASAYGWFDPVLQGKAFSKGQLLSYTWGFGTSGSWIVSIWIGVAALIWLLGILALTRVVTGSGFLTEGMFVAMGAGLIFLSIGLVYVILVPPFQTPDEPNHFLTYAALNNRNDLAEDALRLANAAHFERIKFRTDEHFSAADAGKPMPGGWANHVGAIDPNRSPIVRVAWALTANFLKTGHSGIALLSLRILDVLFVSACLALSLTLGAWALRTERFPAFLAAPAILTPSIGFFSMALSNYAFLVGGYIIQAIALGILWAQSAGKTDNHRVQAVAGGLAGFGLALAAASADNGVLSSAFWALLIPLYWFFKGLQPSDTAFEWKPWALFITSFLGGMLVVWLIIGFFISSFHILPPKLTSFVGAAVSGSFLRHMGPQTLILFGFLMSVVSASLLMLCAGSLSRHLTRIGKARTFVICAMLFGAFLVAISKWVRIPIPERPAVLHSVACVMLSFFQGFIPGKPDWLVVESFWGQFGWLDTPLPGMLVATLRFGAAAGLFLLLYFCLKKSRFYGQAGFLAANLFSLLAFLSCVAAGYYFLNIPTNSRYLIGPYLLILIPAYEGYRRLFENISVHPPSAALVNSGVCLVCMAIQCTAWVAVLNRYF